MCNWMRVAFDWCEALKLKQNSGWYERQNLRPKRVYPIIFFCNDSNIVKNWVPKIAPNICFLIIQDSINFIQA